METTDRESVRLICSKCYLEASAPLVIFCNKNSHSTSIEFRTKELMLMGSKGLNEYRCCPRIGPHASAWRKDVWKSYVQIRVT
jgi:hypothetical protein